MTLKKKRRIDTLETEIRSKWAMEGSTTLSEAAGQLRGFANELEEMEKQGWKLVEPIEDGCGQLYKKAEKGDSLQYIFEQCFDPDLTPAEVVEEFKALGYEHPYTDLIARFEAFKEHEFYTHNKHVKKLADVVLFSLTTNDSGRVRTQAERDFLEGKDV
jgi:hypothetical protein